MKIAIGLALLALVVGGVMYIISAGNPKTADMGKTTIKNAIIGFIIIFAAYLIVNYTIFVIGTQTNLGIEKVDPTKGWSNFKCKVN